MSSILYGAEASMSAGSVLSSGFHIIGLQNSTNIAREDSSSGSEIETGSINDFASNTAEFDFISTEVTEGILDTGTEGASGDAALDLSEGGTDDGMGSKDLNSTEEIGLRDLGSGSEMAEDVDSGFEFFPMEDPLDGQSFEIF